MPDDDAFAVRIGLNRAGAQTVHHALLARQVGRRNAVDKGAGDTAPAARQDFSPDHRCCGLDPFDGARLLDQVAVIIYRAVKCAHHDMRLQPEHAGQQFFAKAAHHGHHDDQRKDAKSNAEEREHRD